MPQERVEAIEIVEDFSDTASCRGGFLELRRLRCQCRRVDGTRSGVFRVDTVDRPKLDAVAVLIYRRTAEGDVEYFTRENLRPAVYFRKERQPRLDGGREHLFMEEIVAGLLEDGEDSPEGLLCRARAEALEEAGLDLPPDRFERLGQGFCVAPGIISEKIFLVCADATGVAAQRAEGDGSPLEEHGRLRWRSEKALWAAIDSGEIQDAKTELALRRFVSRSGADSK